MYIQYKTEVKGITNKQVLQLPLNVGPITDVELNFQETNEFYDILFITFLLSTPVTLEDAEKITTPLLDNIINLMVYKFNATFKKSSINGYKNEDGHVIARGAITLHNLQQHELTDTDCAWLDTEINSSVVTSKLKSNAHFLQYKSILTVEDKISRFLLLYGLLYEIKGDQRSVDTYIKTKEPNVALLQTTREDRSYNETIYTWWRNQAQHMQNDTDIEKVKQHFVELVDSLQKLTFDAITI